MSNKQTRIHATKDSGGSRLAVQQTSTDSPILPAENLIRLKEIDPELVSWVVRQTEIEAEHRRKETTRVNRFVFTERILGVILGAGVAFFGMGIAAWLALSGHDWVASVVGGGTLVALVTVIVGYNKRKADAAPKARTASGNTKNR